MIRLLKKRLPAVLGYLFLLYSSYSWSVVYYFIGRPELNHYLALRLENESRLKLQYQLASGQITGSEMEGRENGVFHNARWLGSAILLVSTSAVLAHVLSFSGSSLDIRGSGGLQSFIINGNMLLQLENSAALAYLPPSPANRWIDLASYGGAITQTVFRPGVVTRKNTLKLTQLLKEHLIFFRLAIEDQTLISGDTDSIQLILGLDGLVDPPEVEIHEPSAVEIVTKSYDYQKKHMAVVFNLMNQIQGGEVVFTCKLVGGHPEGRVNPEQSWVRIGPSMISLSGQISDDQGSGVLPEFEGLVYHAQPGEHRGGKPGMKRALFFNELPRVSDSAGENIPVTLVEPESVDEPATSSPQIEEIEHEDKRVEEAQAEEEKVEDGISIAFGNIDPVLLSGDGVLLGDIPAEASSKSPDKRQRNTPKPFEPLSGTTEPLITDEKGVEISDLQESEATEQKSDVEILNEEVVENQPIDSEPVIDKEIDSEEFMMVSYKRQGTSDSVIGDSPSVAVESERSDTESEEIELRTPPEVLGEDEVLPRTPNPELPQTVDSLVTASDEASPKPKMRPLSESLADFGSGDEVLEEHARFSVDTLFADPASETETASEQSVVEEKLTARTTFSSPPARGRKPNSSSGKGKKKGGKKTAKKKSGKKRAVQEPTELVEEKGGERLDPYLPDLFTEVSQSLDIFSRFKVSDPTVSGEYYHYATDIAREEMLLFDLLEEKQKSQVEEKLVQHRCSCSGHYLSNAAICGMPGIADETRETRKRAVSEYLATVQIPDFKGFALGLTRMMMDNYDLSSFIASQAKSFHAGLYDQLIKNGFRQKSKLPADYSAYLAYVQSQYSHFLSLWFFGSYEYALDYLEDYVELFEAALAKRKVGKKKLQKQKPEWYEGSDEALGMIIGDFNFAQMLTEFYGASLRGISLFMLDFFPDHNSPGSEELNRLLELQQRFIDSAETINPMFQDLVSYFSVMTAFRGIRQKPVWNDSAINEPLIKCFEREQYPGLRKAVNAHSEYLQSHDSGPMMEAAMALKEICPQSLYVDFLVHYTLPDEAGISSPSSGETQSSPREDSNLSTEELARQYQNFRELDKALFVRLSPMISDMEDDEFYSSSEFTEASEVVDTILRLLSETYHAAFHPRLAFFLNQFLKNLEQVRGYVLTEAEVMPAVENTKIKKQEIRFQVLGWWLRANKGMLEQCNLGVIKELGSILGANLDLFAEELQEWSTVKKPVAECLKRVSSFDNLWPASQGDEEELSQEDRVYYWMLLNGYSGNISETLSAIDWFVSKKELLLSRIISSEQDYLRSFTRILNAVPIVIGSLDWSKVSRQDQIDMLSTMVKLHEAFRTTYVDIEKALIQRAEALTQEFINQATATWILNNKAKLFSYSGSPQAKEQQALFEKHLSLLRILESEGEVPESSALKVEFARTEQWETVKESRYYQYVKQLSGQLPGKEASPDMEGAGTAKKKKSKKRKEDKLLPGDADLVVSHVPGLAPQMVNCIREHNQLVSSAGDWSRILLREPDAKVRKFKEVTEIDRPRLATHVAGLINRLKSNTALFHQLIIEEMKGKEPLPEPVYSLGEHSAEMVMRLWRLITSLQLGLDKEQFKDFAGLTAGVLNDYVRLTLHRSRLKKSDEVSHSQEKAAEAWSRHRKQFCAEVISKQLLPDSSVIGANGLMAVVALDVLLNTVDSVTEGFLNQIVDQIDAWPEQDQEWTESSISELARMLTALAQSDSFIAEGLQIIEKVAGLKLSEKSSKLLGATQKSLLEKQQEADHGSQQDDKTFVAPALSETAPQAYQGDQEASTLSSPIAYLAYIYGVNDWLNTNRLKLLRTPPSGLCMYHAVSLQTGLSVMEMLEGLMTVIRAHGTLNGTFDPAYVQQLLDELKQGLWGNTDLLPYIALMFQRPVVHIMFRSTDGDMMVHIIHPGGNGQNYQGYGWPEGMALPENAIVLVHNGGGHYFGAAPLGISEHLPSNFNMGLLTGHIPEVSPLVDINPDLLPATGSAGRGEIGIPTLLNKRENQQRARRDHAVRVSPQPFSYHYASLLVLMMMSLQRQGSSMD